MSEERYWTVGRSHVEKHRKYPYAFTFEIRKSLDDDGVVMVSATLNDVMHILSEAIRLGVHSFPDPSAR